jgi:hypothetical protein
MAIPAGFTKIDLAIIKASRERLLAGKRITAAEKELCDRYEAAQEEQAAAAGGAGGPGSSKEQPWTVRSAALAELLGVTQKTIAAWVKLGMPREAFGIYNFRRVFPWWMDNINSGPEDRDETVTAAKKRFWLEKVENLRLKNGILRGEFVAVEEVLQAHGAIVGSIKNAVRSWASRLPPMIAGKSQEEMLPVIRAEMDAALRTLSASLIESTKRRRRKKK